MLKVQYSVQREERNFDSFAGNCDGTIISKVNCRGQRISQVRKKKTSVQRIQTDPTVINVRGEDITNTRKLLFNINIYIYVCMLCMYVCIKKTYRERERERRGLARRL